MPWWLAGVVSLPLLILFVPRLVSGGRDIEEPFFWLALAILGAAQVILVREAFRVARRIPESENRRRGLAAVFGLLMTQLVFWTLHLYSDRVNRAWFDYDEAPAMLSYVLVAQGVIWALATYVFQQVTARLRDPVARFKRLWRLLIIACNISLIVTGLLILRSGINALGFCGLLSIGNVIGILLMWGIVSVVLVWPMKDADVVNRPADAQGEEMTQTDGGAELRPRQPFAFLTNWLDEPPGWVAALTVPFFILALYVLPPTAFAATRSLRRFIEGFLPEFLPNIVKLNSRIFDDGPSFPLLLISLTLGYYFIIRQAALLKHGGVPSTFQRWCTPILINMLIAQSATFTLALLGQPLWGNGVEMLMRSSEAELGIVATLIASVLTLCFVVLPRGELTRRRFRRLWWVLLSTAMLSSPVALGLLKFYSDARSLQELLYLTIANGIGVLLICAAAWLVMRPPPEP